jgi:hypothetical protein
LPTTAGAFGLAGLFGAGLAALGFAAFGFAALGFAGLGTALPGLPSPPPCASATEALDRIMAKIIGAILAKNPATTILLGVAAMRGKYSRNR